jgi:iron complex transport system ATP-binding protein
VTNDSPLLKVEKLRVVRANQTLLQEISFSLQAGEVLAVLGANGAGKSTLLSALAGEFTASSRTISIDETSMDRFDAQALAERRALNVVEPPLAFSLSVFEYVSLGKPFADIDCAAILNALELCHAAQWMNRDAASLSSGELLRVQLARSLYQLGERARCLWLLDEPLAHLDLAQRQFVLTLIRKIASERQWAIVFSTHDPRDAAQVSDHALLLSRGEVIGCAPPKQVLTAKLLSECYGVQVANSSLV